MREEGGEETGRKGEKGVEERVGMSEWRERDWKEGKEGG